MPYLQPDFFEMLTCSAPLISCHHPILEGKLLTMIWSPGGAMRKIITLIRAHGLLSRAHGLLNHVHELVIRAHDLVIRAHGLVIRAHGLA